MTIPRELVPEQVIFEDGSVLHLNSMMLYLPSKTNVAEFVENITQPSLKGSRLTIIIKPEKSVGFSATTAIID